MIRFQALAGVIATIFLGSVLLVAQASAQKAAPDQRAASLPRQAPPRNAPSDEPATPPSSSAAAESPTATAGGAQEQEAGQESGRGEDLERRIFASPDGLRGVIKELVEREQALAVRSQEIERRGAALQLLAVELRENLEYVRFIEAIVAQFETKQRSFEAKKLGSFVQLYESMRAEAAAKLYQRLPLEMAVKLLRELRETKAAKIFEQLSADLAARITTAFLKPVRLESMAEPQDLERLVQLTNRLPPRLAADLTENLSDGTLLVMLQKLPQPRARVILHLLDPARARALGRALALESLQKRAL